MLIRSALVHIAGISRLLLLLYPVSNGKVCLCYMFRNKTSNQTVSFNQKIPNHLHGQHRLCLDNVAMIMPHYVHIDFVQAATSQAEKMELGLKC